MEFLNFKGLDVEETVGGYMFDTLDEVWVVLIWEAEETWIDSLFEFFRVGEFNSFYFSKALIGE